MITKGKIKAAADADVSKYVRTTEGRCSSASAGSRLTGFIAGAEWTLRQQRWIPVEKALPEENEGVVSILYNEPFFGSETIERGAAKYSHEDNKWYSLLTGGRLIQIEVYNVTHWQQMPPIP